MKQIQDAYIVAATRTPIGKSHKGFFRNYRPDDLLATTLKAALAQVPGLDPAAIEDIICGCAIPEAQQGLNVARISAVLAGLPTSVGGITVNRFCASGLSAVAMAADRIRVGEADVMIAAGVESMSMVPMMGNAPSLSPSIFERDGDVGIAYGMGLTAEKVAQQWKVSRDAQDAFALESHRRALAAQQAGEFKDEITPIEVTDRSLDLAKGEPVVRTRTVELDEGARPDTSLEGLGKLRTVFAARGSVTAGNSSQTSDGAGALILASGAAVQRFGLTPLARFVSYASRACRRPSWASAPSKPSRPRCAMRASSRTTSTGSSSTKPLPPSRWPWSTRWGWTPPRSIPWAAPSPWATRWVPQAPSARPPWCMRCAASNCATAW